MTGAKFFNAEAFTAKFRAFLRVILGLFLISPYLIWLLKIEVWAMPLFGEWSGALITASLQAFLSALLSLIVGWILCLGYLSMSSRRVRQMAEISLLLPNVVPPLFLVLGLMNLVVQFISFPFGIGAVIFAHALMNAGLVAIAMERLIQTRLGGMAEAAYLLGVSPFSFWRKVAFPVLLSDMAILFLFVFSVSFTSFSIPLLIGGETAATLEVVIYDYIRMEGAWGKALILAATQSALIFLFAVFLPKAVWPSKPQRRAIGFLSSGKFKIMVWIPSLLILLGWMFGLSQGFREYLEPGILASLPEAALTSIVIAVTVGFFSLLLFLVISFITPHSRLESFLNGYLAPSAVITGFAMLLLPGEGQLMSLLKISGALTLIFLPLLYRWLIHSSLKAINQQVYLARLMGASWGKILIEISLPQISQPVFKASGLAALWASGDFAISTIIGGGLSTLPLMISDLLGSYRLEAAQLLMLPLLVLGLVVFYAFRGLGYVAR